MAPFNRHNTYIHPGYRYSVNVVDRIHVRVECFDDNHQSVGSPRGRLRYNRHRDRILQLCAAARGGMIQPPEIEELGERLFNSLFDDRLRTDFCNQHALSRRTGVLLNLELDIDSDLLPELAHLPWEFMRLPREAQIGGFWLATTPQVTLCRRRRLWIEPPPPIVRPPERLKIGLAVAAPVDEELGPVKYEEIWDALRKLGSTYRRELDVLPIARNASLSGLDELLRQRPHILHFIGHARFKAAPPLAEIALVDGTLNTAIWVSAPRFGELFTRHQPILVLLQACEGAATSASDGLMGLASQIVQQDVPSVVAMQYAMSNAIARSFSLEFYEQIVLGQSIGASVQIARRKLALQRRDGTSRDFATPVVYSRFCAPLLARQLPKLSMRRLLVAVAAVFMLAVTVGLWESRGIYPFNRVVVPDVIGLRGFQAETTLRKNGLVPVTFVDGKQIDDGTGNMALVESEDPPQSSLCWPSGKVALQLVSSVPDVRGMTVHEARDYLIQCGFQCRVNDGNVLGSDSSICAPSDPPAGTRGRRGTIVLLRTDFVGKYVMKEPVSFHEMETGASKGSTKNQQVDLQLDSGPHDDRIRLAPLGGGTIAALGAFDGASVLEHILATWKDKPLTPDAIELPASGYLVLLRTQGRGDFLVLAGAARRASGTIRFVRVKLP